MSIEQADIIVKQAKAYLMLYRVTDNIRYKEVAFKLFKQAYDAMVIKELE